MPHFSAVLIGNESLAIQCGEMLREAGHSIAAVVTRNPDIAEWAKGADLPVISSDAGLAQELSGLTFAKRGAVNFHDGPLPRYAGLNAPVWALINGEVEYGISWHMISGGVDEGALVAQQFFDITPDETTLTLNTKCYGAAMESFATVIDKLATPEPALSAQDLSQRCYFAKNARPDGAGRLDFTKPARAITTLVRALDHGDYWNPLTCPKIEHKARVWLVGKAASGTASGGQPAGTVLDVSADSLTVATATAPVTLSGLRDATGAPVTPAMIAAVGDVLPSPDAKTAEALSDALKATLKAEPHWRAALERMAPVSLPMIDMGAAAGDIEKQALTLPKKGKPEQLHAALALLGCRLGDTAEIDIAFDMGHRDAGYLNAWAPVRSDAHGTGLQDQIKTAQDKGPFAADLMARVTSQPATPALGLSQNAHIPGTALTLSTDGTLFSDSGKITADAATLMARRIAHVPRRLPLRAKA